MDIRKTRRTLVGLTALGVAMAIGGCDAGAYETDVMTPAIIVQTNTQTGEIRACAVVRLIEDAARSARLTVRAMEPDAAGERPLSDDELERRERAILERERAQQQGSAADEGNSHASERRLVECTEWTARG